MMGGGTRGPSMSGGGMRGGGIQPSSGVRCSLPWATMLAAIVIVGAPSSLLAQSGLEQVERLTRMGRTEEARVALTEWWEDGRTDASRRELQRGLWLRGRLTVDPVQAELDFQRLIVLYPSGQFTPDAVLRLAQASYALGNEEAARRYVETLVRDYPRSEARERAEDWLADAGPVPPPGDTPTRVVEADDPPDDPVRRDRPVVPPRDVEEVDPAPAEAAMNYFVQLGAFADEERALALFDEVKAVGVDVRVVRVEGSRFTHVRVGRFAQRQDAVDRLEELAEAGISAALVRDDRPEQMVRS